MKRALPSADQLDFSLPPKTILGRAGSCTVSVVLVLVSLPTTTQINGRAEARVKFFGISSTFLGIYPAYCYIIA
jgi:hypothetical protein